MAQMGDKIASKELATKARNEEYKTKVNLILTVGES
jgi:hypothetical protein